MFYIVYKTTNLINGKVYIGKHKTNDLNDGYLGSGNELRAAIKKYGAENFSREVLHFLSNEDEMDSKEAELVTEEFIKLDSNYNRCPGGKGGWGYVNTLEKTRESRRLGGLKGSRTTIERYGTAFPGAATNIKCRQSFLGKKHTKLAKERIGRSNSERQKGSRNSQFDSMWITDGLQNRKINRSESIPEGWSKGRKMGRVLGHS